MVYCQLDGGSQLTFTLDELVQELGLEPCDKVSLSIETLTGNKLTHANLVKLDLQSLFSTEMFNLSNIVSHSPWRDNEDTLPHKQVISSYRHFQDVELFESSDEVCADLLIGNDNAVLMAVLEEREGLLRSETHAVLIPLDWLACGGMVSLQRPFVKVCRVQAEAMDFQDEQIRELEQALKDVCLRDATPDSSRNDKPA